MNKLILRTSFLILILWSTYVSANSACVGLFVKESETPAESPSVSEAALDLTAYTHKLLMDWNELLGNKQILSINFLLSPVDILQSAYRRFTKTLDIGVHTFSNSLTVFKTILAHEFAHAIFNKYFVFTFEGQSVSMETLNAAAHQAMVRNESNPQYQNLLREMQELSGALFLARSAGNLKGEAEILSIMESKQKELDIMAPEMREHGIFVDVVIAYEELFADIFAALMTKNKSAMTEAFLTEASSPVDLINYASAYRTQNPDAPPLREFSTTSFKNWKHELSDEYTLFDPARGVLWNLYLKNLKNSDIPLFIDVYFRAVEEHMVWRTKNHEDMRVSARASDPEILNREFVLFFVAVAKDYGLLIDKR